MGLPEILIVPLKSVKQCVGEQCMKRKILIYKDSLVYSHDPFDWWRLLCRSAGSVLNNESDFIKGQDISEENYAVFRQSLIYRKVESSS